MSQVASQTLLTRYIFEINFCKSLKSQKNWSKKKAQIKETNSIDRHVSTKVRKFNGSDKIYVIGWKNDQQLLHFEYFGRGFFREGQVVCEETDGQGKKIRCQGLQKVEAQKKERDDQRQGWKFIYLLHFIQAIIIFFRTLL